MLNVAALSVALLLAAAIIFLAQKLFRPKRRVVPHHAKAAKPKNYAAVSIRTNTRACSAAQDLSGKRFLALHAPVVPLTGCTTRPCPCRYEHFADRRMDDRRAQFGIRDTFKKIPGADRRRNERRHTAASA
jgi:hypothetical protein